MLLRALPHTPGHDGVRLFLPAFGVLALLGGLGARYMLDRWGRWAKAAIAAALLEGIVSIVVMMPVPLSYFSPLVGGLPGANGLGDGTDILLGRPQPGSAADGSPNTPSRGETILFATIPHSWLYLRQIGALPARLVPIDRGLPKWYVLQNRPGAFSAVDRSLAADGRPAYTVTKLGIPLIWSFPSANSSDLTRGFIAETGTFRSGAISNPARPTGLLRKWTSRMIMHESAMRSCKIENQSGWLSAEPRSGESRWDRLVTGPAQ